MLKTWGVANDSRDEEKIERVEQLSSEALVLDAEGLHRYKGWRPSSEGIGRESIHAISTRLKINKEVCVSLLKIEDRVALQLIETIVKLDRII